MAESLEKLLNEYVNKVSRIHNMEIRKNTIKEYCSLYSNSDFEYFKVFLDAEYYRITGEYEKGTYSKQKDYNKAIEYYIKALKLNNKYVPAYNGLGSIYSNQKEYEKAKEN
ncbi:MAG TPA: tetratricopeptide repeat protein, partial [Clostridia bacterium]|nr:tetratricopeptide repeat protein [Clostridia bacterium]